MPSDEIRAAPERTLINLPLSAHATRARHAFTRIPAPWRRRGVIVLGLVIGGLALAFSARGVDRQGLSGAFQAVNWWWVAAAGVANVLNIVAQGWAWRIGLEAGGTGPVAARHAIAATWIGKAGNQLLPGKVGEVARIALIRSHLSPEHREITRIAGSVVAQRAFSFLATFIIVACIALVMPLPIDVPGGRWGPPTLLVGLAATVLLLSKMTWLSLPKLGGSGRLRAMAANFAGGAGLLRPSPASVRALGFHLIAVMAQLTMFECLLRGFDVSAPPTAPLLIIALVALVGAVPGTPGGVGLQQAALVAPLGAAYGVEPSAALAFALGLQATLAAVAVVGGLVALVHHRRSFGMRTVFP